MTRWTPWLSGLALMLCMTQAQAQSHGPLWFPLSFLTGEPTQTVVRKDWLNLRFPTGIPTADQDMGFGPRVMTTGFHLYKSRDGLGFRFVSVF